MLPLLLNLSSCGEHRVSWDTDSTAIVKSDSYIAVEEEIEALDTTDWRSANIFNSLLNVKIGEASSLGVTDQTSLREGLYKHYADQLTRTMSHILNSDCGPRHSTLYAANQEYEKQKKNLGSYAPADRPAVEAAFSEHEEMMAFSISPSYDVAVTDCLDAYDSSYDSRKHSEAAAIRAKNPVCSVIREKVSENNVNKVLNQRRENYYNRLVSRFCADPAPEAYKRDRLKAILGGSSNGTALRNRVDAHWEKCNSY